MVDEVLKPERAADEANELKLSGSDYEVLDTADEED